jgi:hypothetical protein
MKKISLLFLAAVSFLAVHAQKGSIRFQPAFEISIPTGEFGDASNTGFGGSIKGLFGVAPAASITVYTAALFHQIKGIGDLQFTIVPILAGYQHSFDGFYIEPQMGVGIYNASANVLGVSVSDSQSAFTYAIGFGYLINHTIDLGARFQGAATDGSNTNLIGLHIGYNFGLNRK